MKIIGRRDPEKPVPFVEYWNTFVEFSLALHGGGFPIPRGVWRFRNFEEAKEWEDRMLLGEKPAAGPPLKRI
ncbi:MAG: hypothetical protein AB1510_04565 [Bacillota bacterium]